MKTKYIFMAAALLATGTAKASQAGDTTIIVEKPDKVILNETSQDVKVTVEGQKGNPNYHYEYTAQLGKDSIFETSETNDVGILLPFQKRFENRYGREQNFHEYHLPDFTIGFSTAVNGASGVSTSVGSGVEIGFTPILISGPNLGKHWSTLTGIGFDWRNYRMTGDTRFVKNGNSISLDGYPAGSNIKFSRIKIFSIQIPLLAEWNTKSHGKDFFFNAGPVLCINTYASLKTRYKLDGVKYKDFDKHIHPVPFTADLFASAGIDDVGIYIRWSPFHVLQTDFGPRFNTLSFGLTFSFY